MKVAAEFEDQVTALNAHKALIDKGADPEDIELRSPYPLAEEPIPPHRSKPMIMRTLVRLMWLCGIIGGFSFLTFTQLEWGLTAKTGGQPLVAIPINSIIMYECGMICAILTTTLMFFIETRRYRQLVPALEEDMPVAIGYIVLVISGDTAKKAKEWLDGHGARNIVTYMLPLMLLGVLGSGCATGNMRYQQVIKPTERSAELPPAHSLRMPMAGEQNEIAPDPFAFLYYGDAQAYERAQETLDSKLKEIDEKRKAGEMSGGDANRAKKALREEVLEQHASKLEVLKSAGRVPDEMADWQVSVEPNEASLARGAELYKTNCAMCHGADGKQPGKVGEIYYVAPPAIGGATYADKGVYSDAYLYYFIATGKNQMPSFGQKLSPYEISCIINHLRKSQGAL